MARICRELSVAGRSDSANLGAFDARRVSDLVLFEDARIGFSVSLVPRPSPGLIVSPSVTEYSQCGSAVRQLDKLASARCRKFASRDASGPSYRLAFGRVDSLGVVTFRTPISCESIVDARERMVSAETENGIWIGEIGEIAGIIKIE